MAEMNRSVHKYPFVIQDEVTMLLPRGAKIVLVETQNGQAMMWCEVLPGFPMVPRNFRIYGTGMIIRSDCAHVASFQDDVFVWHLYEVINRD